MYSVPASSLGYTGEPIYRPPSKEDQRIKVNRVLRRAPSVETAEESDGETTNREDEVEDYTRTSLPATSHDGSAPMLFFPDDQGSNGTSTLGREKSMYPLLSLRQRTEVSFLEMALDLFG